MSDIITSSFFLFDRLVQSIPERSIRQKQVSNEASNLDIFLTSFQAPEIPNVQASDPVGPPTSQRVQQRITQLAQALKLTFNKEQQYYTDNAGAIYYPQLNGSLYITGRKAKNGDPIEPLTVILNQQTNQPENRTEKSRPLLHTMIIRELRLTPNKDWTFTSPLHPDVIFHLQLDGSVWGSDKIAYRLGADNSLIKQKNSNPLPFTTAIPQIGLYPLRLDNPTNEKVGIIQGAFMKTGDSGMYVPQPDGTIFYTGRINPRTETDPGGSVGPYVYQGKANKWAIDQKDKRNAPMSGSLALSSIKAYQDVNGNWLAPSTDSNSEPYSITLLEKGKAIRYREGSKDLKAFSYNPENNSWTQLPDRYNSKTVPISDGTWKYEGYFQFANGDSIYYLPDKTVMFLGAPSNDLSVFMVDDSGKIIRVGKRGTDPNNLATLFPDDKDVAIGIQTILKSRKERNWQSSAENMITQMKATPNYDGTWAYYGDNKSDHGDSMYLMPDGRFLILDRQWGDCGVWINDGNGWKKQPKERSGVNLSNLDFKNIYPDDQMIAYGIERIIRSRVNLGVGKDKPSEPTRPALTSMPYQGAQWGAHSATYKR